MTPPSDERAAAPPDVQRIPGPGGSAGGRQGGVREHRSVTRIKRHRRNATHELFSRFLRGLSQGYSWIELIALERIIHPTRLKFSETAAWS
jgi:hypothetical protein